MFSKKKIKVEDVKQTLSNEIQRMNSNTCCFTGHRSQKLPWKFNENDDRYVAMRNTAKIEIEKAIQNGYINFMCGMALGFDMICAEIVLELKAKYPQIKLIAAIPCKGQDKMWPQNQKDRYKVLLKQVDKIRCIYDGYVDGCMIERNEYMLNNSSMVIALFNGLPGGTQSTLSKANKQGLNVVIIKP